MTKLLAAIIILVKVEKNWYQHLMVASVLGPRKQ